MRSLSRSAALLGVGALVLVGGGAYALGSSLATGTITVCVNHTNSTLYKATTCRTGDTKLTWNIQGPPGPRGATGAAGHALAYAHVLYNDTTRVASLDASQTSGMTGATVTAVGSGGFCFGRLPFTPHNAMVTIDYWLSPSRADIGQVNIKPGGTADDCPTGSVAYPVHVETLNAYTGDWEHSAFYISFN